MPKFFDPSNPEDLALLHSSVRDNAELDNVVDKVQWEVLNFYTEGTGDGMRIRLKGYDGNDSTEDLKEALRRTIADVASHILRSYDNTLNAQSIRQGQRSVTYASITNADTWSSGWNYRLGRFDLRRPIYAI